MTLPPSSHDSSQAKATRHQCREERLSDLRNRGELGVRFKHWSKAAKQNLVLGIERVG